MREICGDVSSNNRLSAYDKTKYFFFNLIRGLFGIRVSGFKSWSPKSLNRPSLDSPGRQYLDAFLKDELPLLLESKKQTVLDVGCGSGYLLHKLSEIGISGEYHGLDLYKDSRLDFTEDTGFVAAYIEADITKFVTQKRYSLVVSNTALEHVQDDFAAVRNMNAVTAPVGLQVHIVPAFCSLFCYLWHGYRQYNPRMLKKLFSQCNYSVYKLGGLFSFLVHVFLITIPERIIGGVSFRRGRVYKSIVKNAMYLDRYLPFCNLFYVVVVTKQND